MVEDNVGKKLISLVKDKPGIRFLELQRESDIAHGTLEYYLKKLERTGIFRVQRHGKVTRIFPKEFDQSEMNIMSFLRQETSRRLLLCMLQKGKASFKELVDNVEVGPSTVSWHLSKMKEKGLINVGDDRYSYYYIRDKESVVKLLSKYAEGFMDEYVDSFINSSLELF